MLSYHMIGVDSGPLALDLFSCLLGERAFRQERDNDTSRRMAVAPSFEARGPLRREEKHVDYNSTPVGSGMTCEYLNTRGALREPEKGGWIYVRLDSRIPGRHLEFSC